MICQVQGVLESLTENAAVVRLEGGVSYELLLPAFLIPRLEDRIGQVVTFHTIHYLEGGGQGSNFTPRLAGFTHQDDREFFKLFTSVKGIGPRKALRAMSLSTDQIAAAIVSRDAKRLQTMPEIGKRTAETIVAELSGKVDRFADEAAMGAAGSADEAAAPVPSGPVAEAMEVLVQLGETRADALKWIHQARARNDQIDSADRLVAEVFRIKGGASVST
ncbi:MAG: Holliday junction branch migration protein RuvA [Phycisphaeraceae bacterium]|nr:Holliday junction branch migration protein RuvA [Phycisphaeraceae bacterium]